MSRTDLALLLPALSGGGVERVFVNLAGGLAARGLAVELVLLRDRQPRALTPPPGVRVTSLDAPVRSDATFLLALPALARYLRARRPRALYAGITTVNLLALWARRAAGVDTRVVVSEHVPVSVNAGTHPLKRGLPWLVRRAYPAADAVVAVSEALADDLRRVGRLAEVRTLYNPVVSDALLAEAAAEPAHPWFADGGRPLLLAAGRLTAQKGFPTLLRAFVALPRPDARLVVLGDGPDRPALEAEAARLGVGDRVSFPGHAPSVAPYLARADVFCLSSAYEGFPTVLIEALACGCPVVSTDCPTGPREVLDGGRFGELVPVGDAPALAEAIARTLSSPPERATLAARGRTFSVDAACDAVLELLRETGALGAS